MAGQTDGENGAGAGKPMRLHRYLAQCGVASRRACEELIAQGRVQVDGVPVREQGTSVVPGEQDVRLDGEPVRPEKTVYYLVHKPKGYVCSNAPGDAPRRVVDLLRKDARRLYLAGRLDAESEGLVFVTNDGETANRLAHPRYGVPKTYRALVRGRLAPEEVESLRRGVHLAEGKVRPALLKVVGHRDKNTEVEVVLEEGRNREVRRIFARLGHPVKRLTRVAIGPFLLGDLAPGKARSLSPATVQNLLASFEKHRGTRSRAKGKKGASRGRKG